MEFSITNLIIAFTCGLSIWAFSNPDVLQKCKHYPYLEERHKEFYRWLTAGFVHADYAHLAFNMITLYSFGNMVESYFAQLFPMGKSFYLVFYLLGIVLAGAPTFFKHRNNPTFASIGASGAVSAVLFAGILFVPNLKLNMMFIPIPITGWIFGILYLMYSQYASRNSQDNIDHEAHFYGAVFGFLLPIVLKPSLFGAFLAELLG
jgi:membrane associated rhomboid family serine protease